jgi:hypothetical protein
MVVTVVVQVAVVMVVEDILESDQMDMVVVVVAVEIEVEVGIGVEIDFVDHLHEVIIVV